jgi:hypothetical protein
VTSYATGNVGVNIDIVRERIDAEVTLLALHRRDGGVGNRLRRAADAGQSRDQNQIRLRDGERACWPV